MNAFATIRQRLDVTQKDLAEALGCTQGNVSFYEKGQIVPPPVAKRLIDFATSRGLELSFDTVYAELLTPEKRTKRPKRAAVARP